MVLQGSLLLAVLVWGAVVGYGYLAYPPRDKPLPTFPTADEIAAAIARNLPRTPTPAGPVTGSPPNAANLAALNQLREERDSATNNINTSTFGLWRSVDDASAGSTTCSTSNTWQQIQYTNTKGTSAYPIGWTSIAGGNQADITGDDAIYGYYHGTFGNGGFWGYQN